MIKIINKEDCCGCGACAQKCPKHCIIMTEDNEGFLYPMVNEQFCVNCGLCKKVCSILNEREPAKPMLALAAYNINFDIRLKSSSGGIFALLAEKTIAKGGIVFGARFTKDWMVEISYTETVDGIPAFMGSKYVQAVIGNAYADVKHFLEQGRRVLFTGTPCQVSGLNQYLLKKYDNLLTVDVICHGTPSPKVWKRYLSEITQDALYSVKTCSFRDKGNGWKRFNFHLEHNKDGKTCVLSYYHQENHYMRAFLSNMILRPSCHFCKSRSGRSQSDITIADFWGVQNVHSDMDDDMGTSLVLINTYKGKEFTEHISMRSIPVDFPQAVKDNPCWKDSVLPHPNRERFFKKLERNRSVIRLIDKELIPRISYKQRISLILHKVKQLMALLY